MNTERIEMMVRTQGKTVTHLCSLIGKSRGYLRDVRRRDSVIPREYLEIFAADLGTTAEYLNWETDNPNPVGDEKNVKKAIRVPSLGRVHAGIPLEAIEEIIDYEEIPAKMGKGGAEFFSLPVKGDSMYPRYLEGDVIIVRKQTTCESGQDCVVYVNGQGATLKTVFLLGDGGIRLQPLNPSYPPKTYYPERDSVSFAGVVVELRRKVEK